jgi:hypothetical protein
LDDDVVGESGICLGDSGEAHPADDIADQIGVVVVRAGRAVSKKCCRTVAERR